MLIHALGSAEELGARGDSIADALCWFRAVRDATRWAICYPTLAYLAALDEAMSRHGIVADHRKIALRCDVVVATGGEWSPEMLTVSAGRTVLDLSDLGARPAGDTTRREILRRVADLGLR